jgi:OmcA/MtrC family decaheme c-type cytochrome
MVSFASPRPALLAAVFLALTVSACAKSAKEEARAQADCVAQKAAVAPAQTTAPSILGVCEADDGLTLVFAMRKAGSNVALKSGDAWAALARLVPADDKGTPAHWQSLINRTEKPGTGDWPGTAPQLQATTDNAGELTDLGNGIFSYRLSVNPMSVTSPAKVAWEPDQVHRVGLEFRGDAEDPDLGNPLYTWTPATGKVTDTAHKVVSNENCNECHAKLEAHGGARVSTEYCVLCHNPGTHDAQSGNTVDFKVMVHKIHRWSNGVTSYPEADYKIWGFMNSENNFSDIQFPQNQRNCRKCHDPREKDTPQAALFLAGGDMATCGSCHDKVSFAATVPAGMVAHPGGPQTSDATCAGCHGPKGAASVEQAHLTIFPTPNNPDIPANAATVAYVLHDVALANTTQPTAKFSILFNGEPVNLTALPATFSMGNSPSLRVVYSAPEGSVSKPMDWNNLGNKQPVGQPASLSIKNNAAKFVHNADGSYTAPAGVLPPVPSDAVLVAVGIEGASQVDLDRNGSFTNAERIAGDAVLVGVGMTSGSPRRDIVNTGKCNLCHERLTAHGNNRANNVRICGACHNPSATDILQRPATVDLDATGGYDDFTAVGVDGLHERSIDFRELIHKIHAGDTLKEEYTVYGFGRRAISFNEIGFPGRLGNCLTCHNDGTFTVPLVEGALATTRLSALAATSSTGLRAADDDWNSSPTGAACTGCHDAQSAQAHAFTARLYWSTGISGQESDSCATCHGEGQPYDVSKVHPVSELTADVKKYTPDVVRE